MTTDEKKLNDEKWMVYALTLATRAWDMNEVPVGAVLVVDDEIVGEGWNRSITDCDPTAHAEIVAIRHAAHQQQNYRLSGGTLYVTLEPCAMCVGAMVHGRINRLVFAAPETKNGAVFSRMSLLEQHTFNHNIDVTGGVLADHAGSLLSAFFKQKRLSKKTHSFQPATVEMHLELKGDEAKKA